VRAQIDFASQHHAGSIAEGVTRVRFLEGEDALATMTCFRALGVGTIDPSAVNVTVHGVGLRD